MHVNKHVSYLHQHPSLLVKQSTCSSSLFTDILHRPLLNDNRTVPHHGLLAVSREKQ